MMKLYNVFFPIWLIFLIPTIWLIAIPLNFIIDSIILFISMKVFKIEDKKNFYLKHIFFIFLFGFLSDMLGALMLLTITVISSNISGLELWLALIGVVIASFFIFFFNYSFTFRKIEEEQRRKLSLIFALFTAPIAFLIPTSIFM